MKYVAEFQDSDEVKRYCDAINNTSQKVWRIMEICGGQTHTIAKSGLSSLLKGSVEFIHGPGCPVCVTPASKIDNAIRLAQQSNTILCTYGDMLRVPGSEQSLAQVKALGADIRVIYSPMDAIELAKKESEKGGDEKQVVLFAIGFETTAPGNAAAIAYAIERKLNNFSAIVSQVTVPAAIALLLGQEQVQIDGVLAAGHVCSVMGYHQYHDLVKQYHKPIVVTGFEPVDILQGVYRCVMQLEKGEYKLENTYQRCVTEQGNQPAQALLDRLFIVEDQLWRGIGVIPKSGLRIRDEFSAVDAEKKFSDILLDGTCQADDSTIQPGDQTIPTGDQTILTGDQAGVCQSGLVLQGKIKPSQCPAFGVSCTPDIPLGATMVSTEGACAAYYRYQAL